MRRMPPSLQLSEDAATSLGDMVARMALPCACVADSGATLHLQQKFATELVGMATVQGAYELRTQGEPLSPGVHLLAADRAGVYLLPSRAPPLTGGLVQVSDSAWERCGPCSHRAVDSHWPCRLRRCMHLAKCVCSYLLATSTHTRLLPSIHPPPQVYVNFCRRTLWICFATGCGGHGMSWMM